MLLFLVRVYICMLQLLHFDQKGEKEKDMIQVGMHTTFAHNKDCYVYPQKSKVKLWRRMDNWIC